MKKILVTGSGGIGGVNFVRALRATKKEFHIVGTDFNRYYIQFPEIDIRVGSPRHSDPKFIELISHLISKHSIEFLHPQPSSEAQIIAQNIEKIPIVFIFFTPCCFLQGVVFYKVKNIT